MSEAPEFHSWHYHAPRRSNHIFSRAGVNNLESYVKEHGTKIQHTECNVVLSSGLPRVPWERLPENTVGVVNCIFLWSKGEQEAQACQKKGW